MSAEIEILDQLLGGDLPLDVIAGLFADRDQCRRAILAMLKSGEVRILDATQQEIPLWRFTELDQDSALWTEATPYRLSITDAGAQRVT